MTCGWRVWTRAMNRVRFARATRSGLGVQMGWSIRYAADSPTAFNTKIFVQLCVLRAFVLKGVAGMARL